MDGEGGETAGGEMGGVTGNEGPNGTYGIGMESSDEDSATATLESMGYIDNEAKTSGADGDSTSSGLSVLQSAVILLLAVFGVYVVYSVFTGVLAIFGIQL